MDEEADKDLYLAIADTAADANDSAASYQYLLRALRTIPTEDTSSDDSRALAVRALKAGLSHPSHFDFQDLTALDPVQALRQSNESALFELLEIFTADSLDEYEEFVSSHSGWLESQSLDAEVLQRKIRLLTLASLSAATSSRSLPYSQIARSLRVPAEEVELWVIDGIRVGLVEGKLSQLNQTFLIHRATYRVFGEKQWSEVQGRLMVWRNSLVGVLEVVRSEREKMIREKERELRGVEEKVNGFERGERGMGRRQQQQQQPKEIDAGAD